MAFRHGPIHWENDPYAVTSAISEFALDQRTGIAAYKVRIGSISTESGLSGHVRFTPGSDRMADIPDWQLRAYKRRVLLCKVAAICVRKTIQLAVSRFIVMIVGTHFGNSALRDNVPFGSSKYQPVAG